jgi:hypothetical protein
MPCHFAIISLSPLSLSRLFISFDAIIADYCPMPLILLLPLGLLTFR